MRESSSEHEETVTCQKTAFGTEVIMNLRHVQGVHLYVKHERKACLHPGKTLAASAPNLVSWGLDFLSECLYLLDGRG